MSSTPLVDVHAHFLTDDYVDAAISEAIRATDTHGTAGVVLLSNSGGLFVHRPQS
ncbi:hypothetical protein [Mycolicibacterium peregrinum]|uniref:hypothetical protein n=1 Tax=Mycolicibacterium peregrinum TaxID=43304 RepID=UPI000AB31F11|nr:hypothetical protein [Mycolicibacterium peregrinum]